MLDGIISGNGFCYIDEYIIWNQLYNKYEIKNDFYQIYEQFKMKSQIEAEKNRDDNEKRKSKKRKNNGGASFLNEIQIIVLRTYREYLNVMNHNEKRKQSDESNNNASEAANRSMNDLFNKDVLLHRNKISAINEIEMIGNHQSFINNTEEELIETISTNYKQQIEYLIPRNSKYICGQIKDILSDIHYYTDNKYSLILMDPPWINKSVKRKKFYNCFDKEEMYDYPIEFMLENEGIIIIWITNNETVHQFIPQLLETWGLQQVKQCYWLKITQNNQPIVDFDSHHKVPFESFVIATKIESKIKSKIKEIIPDNFCIISTPSSIHSKKPPLIPIFKGLLEDLQIFSNQSKYLELFSRYLTPHVTSIGNEVLKFQNIEYNFIRKEDNKTKG